MLMTWRWVVGFIFAASAVAASQMPTGSIAGKVVDSTGAPLPGVAISATLNGDRHATATNGLGEYRLELPPGLYRMEARMTSFVTAVAERVNVEAGRTVEWNPVLQVQAVERKDYVAEMQSYVERFTGSAPADCGQHRLVPPFIAASPNALRHALTCASDAAGQRKPFWTFKQNQGIDSIVFEGLLGTTDGTAYRFSYDSAPCGGPGCAGRFTIEKCERPIHLGRGTGFGCQQ